ncbi:hypothetical protein TSAR_005101 [Trichomalopsis sarcophagae]|uniref:Uncharacterized protein n=1 Tax=Trichomalopsis sarcophagae TaxID=543379 RepID=A0A232FM39_9HYME|nr:hypothetical protein TSAR_005101 [Trichomalopsis sarcophagae]
MYAKKTSKSYSHALSDLSEMPLVSIAQHFYSCMSQSVIKERMCPQASEHELATKDSVLKGEVKLEVLFTGRRAGSFNYVLSLFARDVEYVRVGFNTDFGRPKRLQDT